MNEYGYWFYKANILEQLTTPWFPSRTFAFGSILGQSKAKGLELQRDNSSPRT